MKQELIDLIEEANLERHIITDPILYEIANQYSDRELARLVDVFLRGIGKVSNTPHKIINTMWGMGNSFQEYQSYTPKQRIWIVGHLIRYWDQVGVEMRSTLNL